MSPSINRARSAAAALSFSISASLSGDAAVAVPCGRLPAASTPTGRVSTDGGVGAFRATERSLASWLPAPSREPPIIVGIRLNNSIGTGKMIVEFFSAAISVSVCR